MTFVIYTCGQKFGNPDKDVEMARTNEIPIIIREQIVKLKVEEVIEKYRRLCSFRKEQFLKCGRPRSTNAHVDRIIKRIAQANPRKTANDIHQELILSNIHNVSIKTVQRRLREMGLLEEDLLKNHLYQKKNKKDRLSFAKEYITWSIQKWNCVLWSDESKFNLFGNDGKGYWVEPHTGPVRDAKKNQGVGPKQRGRKEKKEKRRTIQKKEESEEDENEDMEKELDFKKILQKQVKKKQKQNKVSASRVADAIPSARKLDGIRIRPNRLNDTTPSPNKSNGTEAGPSGLADTTPGPNRLDSISQNQSQTNKAQRIPPIVINNANNWTTRRNRALARLLKEEKKELHTFSLPEDKKVRAVVGRISESLTEEETLEELKGQGINPISVQRMKSRKDKKALPLVLVQVTIQLRLCHASGKTRHESEIGHQTSQMARKIQTFKKRDDDEKPKLSSLGEIRRLEKEEGKTSSSHKMAELGGKISGNTEMALSIEEYCHNPEMLFEMNQHLYQKNLPQSKEINEFKETNQRLLTALKKMEARLDKLENSSAEEKETKRKKKTLKEIDSERETEQSDEEMNTVDLRQIQNEQRKERKAEIEKRGKEEKERQKPKEKVDQILQVKINKIPPIIINKASDWTTVCNRLKTKKIAYNKAKMTGKGVAITPISAEDYRAMTRFLKEENKEFHTYSLPEDKKVRAVIGLLPENVTEEEVQRDLSGQGIETFSVQRMRSRVDKRTLPLMLVQMEPKDKEKIFNLTRCCDLSVRVEAQRMQPGPNQCHRCQKFGHS
ncbi:eukaryotic translation initiation factor 5B-like [Euwallacea fornicatus]|uniref:eukaryotic translation initiation factor 5B-like n=1 Tax=Euwallacea fornicatus TaxID=995702 RepID=UPI00338FEFCE